jgi:hypothetical protein
VDTDRLFRPLLALLIAAGALFGLAPFLAPGTFASLTGFLGTDVFVYRLAGAATFGYAVGLAAGWRTSWTELRIPIAATLVFNAASILACLAAIVGGGAPPVVYLILLASVLFTAGTAALLRQPPLGATGRERSDLDHPMATWLIALFVIGVAAAAVFGLGPLILGGGFGTILGATGNDPFVYRQAGAATFGAAVGGAMVLMSRRWSAARLPALSALTFNGLSVVAALLQITTGATPVAYLILAAAGLTTVGMAAALPRGGR